MEPTMSIIYFRPNRIRYCHCQLCLQTGLDHDLPLPICPGWGGEGGQSGQFATAPCVPPSWTVVDTDKLREQDTALTWLQTLSDLVSPLKH